MNARAWSYPQINRAPHGAQHLTLSYSQNPPHEAHQYILGKPLRPQVRDFRVKPQSNLRTNSTHSIPQLGSKSKGKPLCAEKLLATNQRELFERNDGAAVRTPMKPVPQALRVPVTNVRASESASMSGPIDLKVGSNGESGATVAPRDDGDASLTGS